MPSMTLFGMGKYLEYLKTEDRRAQLYAFYSDKWFLKKTWDCSKAQQASYDYGIKAILGLVNGSEGHRRPTHNPDGTRTRNAVFAIGLGSFNTRTGLPSKHAELEKRFVKRAKSLGYTVVGCHEYYTSAKCPRVDCNSFLRDTKNRSRYCDECQAYFDRDIAASENIARVCISQLTSQTRPAKFKPDTSS
ncbi:hypothetical protein BGX34_001916 [Mortierella sp. NVP85]|nr:hypothetical protein BGX34_001916 [Mortierella sp. NVP85]